MREWRKLYKGIRESDRLRGADYEARWLYILLLSAQDDAGRYPWTPAKINLLVSATTDWTRDDCDSHATRLRDAGLITLENSMVTIRGGAEKNGIPHNARGKALLYELPSLRLARDSHAACCDSHAAPTRARGEKRREEEDTSPLVFPPPRSTHTLENPFAGQPDGVGPWVPILREIPSYKVTPEQEKRTHERMVTAGFTDDEMVATAMAMVGSKHSKGYVRHDSALFNWIARDRRQAAERAAAAKPKGPDNLRVAKPDGTWDPFAAHQRQAGG